MARRLLPVLLAAAVGLISSPPAAGAGPIVKFRPNLQTLVPVPDESITTTPSGHRQLRLDNAVSNMGTGPIEVKPRKKDCDHDGKLKNDRTAFQRIYQDSNGNGVFDRGVDTTFSARKVGCFSFHAIHDHWHFEDYTTYQLFDLDGNLLKEHSKVGFCLLDSDHVSDGSLPGEPDSQYYGSVVAVCGDMEIQGVSVGWADLYVSSLSGQFIQIDGVGDGDYCLVSTVDPADRIKESNETDNAARLLVNIAGDAVTAPLGTC